MPSREEVVLTKRLDRLEAARRSMVCVRSVISVVVRGEQDGDVRELERVDDLQLLIEPSTGFRRLRHMTLDPELWDEYASHPDTKQVEVVLEVTPAQRAAMVDDESDVNAMFGGHRAGKTTTAAKWLFRQWMLRGGAGELLWWVAPSWTQARIGVRKLVIGRGKSNPPIFPPELVVSYPKTKHSEPEIILIDGSTVMLAIAHADGDGIKGEGYVAAVVDEITSIDDETNWVIVHGRMLDSGGPIAVSSTPKQGHWAYREIVKVAKDNPYRVTMLTCFDNPGISLAATKRKIKALGGEQDPLVRREFFGEWISVGTMAIPDWKEDLHRWPDDDASTVRDMGPPYRDVTDVAAARHFRSHRHGRTPYPKALWVGGQDFNISPMSTVIAQVWEREGVRGLFVVDVVQTKGTIDNHCLHLADRYHPGSLRVSCDATGDYRGSSAHRSPATASLTNVLVMQAKGFDARPCRFWGEKAENPPVKDSLNLTNRLFRTGRIFVARRCRSLIKALETQQASYDGRILKPAGTLADRQSSPLDALRYLVEAVFGHEGRPDAIAAADPRREPRRDYRR